jgi:hypothetical protein
MESLAQACAVRSPPSKGLPDSSGSMGHDGVQGRVLAITAHTYSLVESVRCGRKSNPNKNEGKKIGMKR